MMTFLPSCGSCGQHQLAQFVLDRVGLGGGRVDLGDEHVALVAGGSDEHLAGGVGIGSAGLATAIRLDDRAEFVVPLRQPAQLVGVGQHLGIGQLLLECLVLVDDVAEAFEHGESRLLATRPTPGVPRHSTRRMSTGRRQQPEHARG